MVRIAYFLGALLVLSSPLGLRAGAKEKKVRLEDPFVYKKNKKGQMKLVHEPYHERRSKWGLRFNLAVGGDYETQQEQLKPGTTESAVLESDGMSFKIDISVNRNFKSFSIGPEFGYFSSKVLSRCSTADDPREITFRAPNIGAGVYLDGLSFSQYVTPFASAGALIYPTIETELTTLNTCTLAGGTGEIDSDSFIMYYRFGLLLGLNWLDKGLASRGLSEYGLENSFLYVALRQIPSTSSVEAADIGTTMFIEYGLQLEF